MSTVADETCNGSLLDRSLAELDVGTPNCDVRIDGVILGGIIGAELGGQSAKGVA
jgi:hypothetical protein